MRKANRFWFYLSMGNFEEVCDKRQAVSLLETGLENPLPFPNMTILELIQKTSSYFEKSQIPNPRLDIELLLAHVLNLKRMDLYLQFERVLTNQELDQLRPLVKRRSNREPLQHILGTVDFMGLTLTTSSQALIPRPETELLAERAMELLPHQSPSKILDIGTGSGAIALAILHARPSVSALATDLSEDSLALARQNAEQTKLSARIEFRKGDLFEILQEGELFDMIVSNPPYIPTAEIDQLQKEVQFDPRLALDGGKEGLDILRKLASQSLPYLKSQGILLMEIGIHQKEPVQELLTQQGFSQIDFFKDLQGIERIVQARKIER